MSSAHSLRALRLRFRGIHDECRAALAEGDYVRYSAARQQQNAIVQAAAVVIDEGVRAIGAALSVEPQRLSVAGNGAGRVDVYEHERQRLARELHDGVGQQFAILSAELTIL